MMRFHRMGYIFRVPLVLSLTAFTGQGAVSPALANALNTPEAQLASTFSAYDRNKNGYVEEDEFYEASRFEIDMNRDDHIDIAEWDVFAQSHYLPLGLQIKPFAEYDTNKDTYLDRAEFRRAYQSIDYFAAIDANKDRRLSRDEYNFAYGAGSASQMMAR